MIPIGNIYYLLCYAWNRLDEKDFVEVEALPRQDLPNLLAHILINGVRRLLRQGIDRTYIAQTYNFQNPKGRIDVTDSVKRGLLLRNAVACVVDELSHDVLHNSIIRTTLHRLAATAEVDPSLRHELRTLEKQLEDVSLVALNGEHFARVQLTGTTHSTDFSYMSVNFATLRFSPVRAMGSIASRISSEMKSGCARCSKISFTTSTTLSKSNLFHRANASTGIPATVISKPSRSYPR